MAELGAWILANGDTISGYLILLIGVVAFLGAMSRGTLMWGQNVKTVLADKDAQIAKCGADLLQCQHPPQEVP